MKLERTKLQGDVRVTNWCDGCGAWHAARVREESKPSRAVLHPLVALNDLADGAAIHAAPEEKHKRTSNGPDSESPLSVLVSALKPMISSSAVENGRNRDSE